MDDWGTLEFKESDPESFFRQRWVNSYGEEVHVAKPIKWENVATSLPSKGLPGIVPAADIYVQEASMILLITPNGGSNLMLVGFG